MSLSKEKILKDQRGQTFVEFIFLLIILITISFTFMRGFNALIGNRWQVMLKIIGKPDNNDFTLP